MIKKALTLGVLLSTVCASSTLAHSTYVAKVVAVNGGYHEFELVRTKNVIGNANGIGRLLDNGGAVNPLGNRFRVQDADVGGLARHAPNDVIVFNKLVAGGVGGMVTLQGLDQHP